MSHTRRLDGVIRWHTRTPVANWTEVALDLTPYVGGTRYLTFEFYSDQSNVAEGWYLDDILVTGVEQQPRLNITQSGANALVSWPSYAADFVLQANLSLGTANWTDVGITPTDDGSSRHVVVPANMGSRFYRLKR
jgi:hypothetical protein